MVSLTGSTSAGARVGQVAAAGIKKVTLELGGKSAFIIAPDADFDTALTAAVRGCYINNGQTCTATTRLLVPADRLEYVEQKLAELVGAQRIGDPSTTPSTSDRWHRVSSSSRSSTTSLQFLPTLTSWSVGRVMCQTWTIGCGRDSSSARPW